MAMITTRMIITIMTTMGMTTTMITSITTMATGIVIRTIEPR
jgi:hypothetical protein